MNMAIKKYFLLIWVSILLFCSNVALAQEVAFSATTNAREVVKGGLFEVVYILENGEGENFKLGKLTSFKQVGSTQINSSYSLVNGKPSSKVKYTVTLQALQLGYGMVSPATIKVDTRTLKSNGIQVRVVERAEEIFIDTTNKNPVFIRAELSDTKAYPGQQITLDYKLYTTLKVDNYDVIRQSDYFGFYPRGIRNYDDFILQEVINGRQYNTKIIRRFSLFPQQTGQLTIDPIFIKVWFYSSFGKVDHITISSDPVEIQVEELPDNAPDSFTGAVGLFYGSALINKAFFTTDDAVSVTISYTGDGDLKQVEPPEVIFPDSFDVIEPKLVKEKEFEQKGRVFGTYTYNYTALPKVPGSYKIPCRMTVFQPDSLQFKRIIDTTFQVVVRKGKGKASSTTKEEDKDLTQEELMPNKATTRLKKRGNNFFGSPLFWIIFFIPPVLFTLALIIPEILRKRVKAKQQERSEQEPHLKATAMLSMAKRHLDGKEMKAFYSSVAKALYEYFSTKASIPTHDLTRQKIKAALYRQGFDQLVIDEFIELVDTCEMAVFSGMSGSNDPTNIYKRAYALISNEENRNRKGGEFS